MTIDFNCPHCDKLLKTSEDKAGRQAKCPGCGELITIPGSRETQADSTPQSQPVEGEPLSQPARFPTTPGDTRPCPQCGEQIKAAAIRCRFCGEVFQSREIVRGRPSGYREMRPFPPGEVISDAWRIFTDRMGLLIGAFLAATIITSMAIFAGWMPFGFASVLFDQGNTTEAAVAACVGAVTMILAIGFSFYIQSGYLITHVKAAREQPVEFGDLFAGGRFFLRLFLCSLLFAVIVNIGVSACLIPGLLLGIMFWPFAHVLVDEDRPVIACLSHAKDLTDGNWGSIFIVLIFALACVIAGAFFCGIGVIFAIPFTQVLYAVAYDRMTCQTPHSELNSGGNSSLDSLTTRRSE